jgi:hypothetical protein
MGGQGLEAIPQTRVDDLTLYHPDTMRLGPGVGESVARLVKRYAEQASLADIPPVTLSGTAWAQPWETLAPMRCCGDAGASYDQSRRGVDYRRLMLVLFDQPRPEDPKWPEVRRDIETTIAHEVTHLRWWNLQHGLEFSARVRALLRGATFPPHSSWNAETKHKMATIRKEITTPRERP